MGGWGDTLTVTSLSFMDMFSFNVVVLSPEEYFIVH